MSHSGAVWPQFILPGEEPNSTAVIEGRCQNRYMSHHCGNAGGQLSEIQRYMQVKTWPKCGECKSTGNVLCEVCLGTPSALSACCPNLLPASTGSLLQHRDSPTLAVPFYQLTGATQVDCRKLADNTGKRAAGAKAIQWKDPASAYKAMHRVVCPICEGQGWRVCPNCRGHGAAPACLAPATSGQRAETS